MKQDTFPNLPSFEVLSRLGAGGMGRVYLCRSVGAYGFKKMVAVKVISPSHRNKEAIRAMFQDEARLVAQLDHPAITQVFDFGESEDALYLVMEYVAGISCAELLQMNMRLPPLITASAVAAVGRGLHAAHEARSVDGKPLNVVHRDVTPSNLVLTFAGQMKILDFGIALMRERSAPVTSVGQIRGKPTYLSPEQFEGAPIDRRTDLYSLSIVLHELLTSEKLFRLDDYVGAGGPSVPVNWKDVASSVKPPSATVADIPDGLDDVVMKGLSVDPADRYADAKELAAALEAIVEREGGETLIAYADRELVALRKEHERKVRADASGAEPDDHPNTLDAQPPDLEDATEPGRPTQPGRTDLQPEPATVVEAPPESSRPSSTREFSGLTHPVPTAVGPAPRSILRPAALAALLALGLVAVALATASSPEETREKDIQQTVASPEPIEPKKKPAPEPEPSPEPEHAVAAPPRVSPPPSQAVAKRKPKRRKVRVKPKKRASRSISSDGIMQEW